MLNENKSVNDVNGSQKVKTINNVAYNIKMYFIYAILVCLGWASKTIYDDINIQPISYKTNENISYALDERGRLHIIDLSSQKTIIYSDSVALGINAQVSSRIYQDYLKKTNGEK